MKIFSNISTWILILLLIRLSGITNPPVEISHNWRQCQTAMTARNFVENPSILHPSADMEGGKEIAMEFPLFNYLVFLAIKVFGFAHWYGRLINLLITSAGLFFFFKIVRELISERAAFFATLILGVSIFFSFGRKIMPDTFSVSLVLFGIYTALLFVKEKNNLKNILWFLFTTLFLSLGTLSKLPSITLFAFLIYPLLRTDVSNAKKSVLLLSIFTSLLIVAWWYAVWNSKLEAEGAIRIIFPLTLKEGFLATIHHLPGVLEKFYFSTLCSYAAFIFFLTGTVYAFIRKEKKLLFLIGISFTAFSVFVLKSATFFYFHNYYIIPIAPVMSVAAGFGLSQIKNIKLQGAVLLIITAEAVLNQQHDFHLRTDMLYKTGLENIVARFTAPRDKIFINTGPSLQQLYFANRKGWILDAPATISLSRLDSISDKHFSIVVLDKLYPTAYESSEFTPLFSDEHYTILAPNR